MILNTDNNELNVLANELSRLQFSSPKAYTLMFSPRISNFFQKNHQALTKLRVATLDIYEAHIEKDEKGQYKSEEAKEGEVPEFAFKSAQDKADFEAKMNDLMKQEVKIIL